MVYFMVILWLIMMDLMVLMDLMVYAYHYLMGINFNLMMVEYVVYECLIMILVFLDLMVNMVYL